MGTCDLPDIIYALALGPVALVLVQIYQANHACPCYYDAGYTPVIVISPKGITYVRA